MRNALAMILMLLLFGGSIHAEERPASDPAKRQEELEKELERKLSGATFTGNFTLGKVTPETKLKEDRYTITKATKLKDDFWMIQTRIQYGGHDVTVPLPLRIVWAGDTPVITLDDLPVPGLGSFTARVLIYKDEYAGTWSGKDHGGHLFGRIEKNEPRKE